MGSSSSKASASGGTEIDDGHAVGSVELQRVAPIGTNNGDSSTLRVSIASLGAAEAAISGSKRVTNERRFIRPTMRSAGGQQQIRYADGSSS